MNRRDFIIVSSATLLLPLISRGNSKINLPVTEKLFSQTTKKKVIIPPEGMFYHGVHPGRPEKESSGREDDFNKDDIDSYESKETGVDRKGAFIYFSNNWNISKKTIEFPRMMCDLIDCWGSIPFIRLMLRSTEETNELKLKCENGRYKVKSEKHKMGELSLDKILTDRNLKTQLNAWGKAAKEFKKPIIVEWGTEMNGFWFEWNGWWNGKASNGANKFKQVYNYIRQQIEDVGGADNITWVFHVTVTDAPTNDDSDCVRDGSLDWNKFENYYPGDFIDWFGVSVYGAQKLSDTECPPFAPQMKSAYERFQTIDSSKPIFVLEFGTTKNSVGCGQASDDCTLTSNGAAKWADEALEAIFTTTEWKMIRGFSWWNEAFEDDGQVNMRVQDNPCLRQVFQNKLSKYKDKIFKNPNIK